MPEVSWQTMMRDHPAGHLVVEIIASVTAQDAVGSQRKPQLALLASLARSLRLRGMYALAAVPEREGTNVHVAFEHGSDATALAEAVGAAGIVRYPGWKTQRSFLFDDAATGRVEAALKVRLGKRTQKSRTRSLFRCRVKQFKTKSVAVPERSLR